MRSYSIPPDMREQSKIVGGIFTITQTAFLAVGIALTLVIGTLLIRIGVNFIIAILIALLCGAPFIPFAFIRKSEYGNIELAQYYLYKFQFSKSNKKWVNINQNFAKYHGYKGRREIKS